MARSHESTIALKPSYAPAHHWLGDLLRRRGDAEAAVTATARGVELDPMAGLGCHVHMQALATAGRWPEARRAALRLRAMGYKDLILSTRLVSHASEFGFTEEEAVRFAREWAESNGYVAEDAAVIGRAMFQPRLRAEALALLRRMHRAGASPVAAAEVALQLGDAPYALTLLEQALASGDPRLTSWMLSPAYAAVADDARYQRILAEVRKPVVPPAEGAARR